MEEISNKVNSDEIWNIELIIVSNENQGIDINQPEIKSISKDFVDKESFLVYEEDSLSSAKSYLIKLSVANLIRITCTDEKERNNYNYTNLEMIKDVNLEMGILYENVRGYLSNSKYNKNIIKTLSDSPQKFFMFNNGITITAKNVKSESKNVNKKYLFTLENMQIVNGGQTLRSIY